VVVAVGLAVGFAQVVQLKPVAGDHAYDVAPFAVRFTLLPAQIAGAAGVTLTVGSGRTVTVMVAVPVQPWAFVPITVYVVVAVGFAVGFAQVVQLKPVAGDHAYEVAPLAVITALPPKQ
jgi:hypothetical protein